MGVPGPAAGPPRAAGPPGGFLVGEVVLAILPSGVDTMLLTAACGVWRVGVGLGGEARAGKLFQQ